MEKILDAENKVLIILGMHRSGTSLTAQWLSHCGLHLGDVLLGKAHSNKFGHFEDKDFLSFHEKIFANRNVNWMSISDQVIFNEFELVEAKEIISNKIKNRSQFGWKEPRTVFFLEEWSKLIPNAKYLIVFRHFSEVSDSIYRRIFNRKTGLKKVVFRLLKPYYLCKYALIWNNYNEELLKFVKKQDFSNDLILISNDALINKSEMIYKVLIKNWWFDLDYVDIKNVYKKGVIKKKRVRVIGTRFFNKTFDELKRLETEFFF